MKPLKIATLITCHNRREKTIACLDTLFNQELDEKCQLFVYLVDDGCSDGTGEAVRKQFPDVKVLEGDGNLYWCGGMRVAWAEAAKKDYDYYVWLNDDTQLFPNTIWVLLDTAEKVRRIDGHDGIIVGEICDLETGRHSYGGVVQTHPRSLLAFKPIEPSDESLRCDTFNGNCVLVSRDVFRKVGNMGAEYTHYFGDTDYGLRARAAGLSCWVTPGYVGECRLNLKEDVVRWAESDVPLWERLRILHSPKGLHPREWRVFVRQHTGIWWPYYWIKPYLRVLFPRLWNKLQKKRSRDKKT
jgi:GT2 family glycosyltransferase